MDPGFSSTHLFLKILEYMYSIRRSTNTIVTLMYVKLLPHRTSRNESQDQILACQTLE